MAKSKLKLALAAEKGVDHKKIKEMKNQKKHKERVKKSRGKKGGAIGTTAQADNSDDDWEGVEEDEEEDENDVGGGASLIDDEASEDSEEEEAAYDLAALDESDSSDSSIDLEEKIERPKKSALKATSSKPTDGLKKPVAQKDADEDDDEEEEEDEEDIPMSDLEDLDDEEKEDLIRHNRLTINNSSALLTSLNRISIPTDKSVPFATHQSLVGAEPTADSIDDVQDDLKRETAFYAQCLDAAKRARALLKAAGVPFSRPTDYFAEMVKDDGHMEKVKAKLVEEASAKKASAEARKQRDLKKFGKQVQVAKLQERQKAKKDTLEKIKNLKRKRQESSNDLGTTEADLFDVGVDQELSKHNATSQFASKRGSSSQPNSKRQKKDAKYGFGGKKKHAKSGDAMSSGDLSGFSARRMKEGHGAGAGGPKKPKPFKAPRPGKSRRQAGAGKR
ncbi:Ebp2-domain-containing protein [Xylariomycetidae sp. FL2044]|nr:Ebp2-domain-containing protein [Xylariomycetidae sp. FL2044]